jgi:signal transduction histidine kinase
MMSLPTLTLAQRLSLLIALFCAGFGVYGIWSFKTLDQLSVNGPVYRKLVQSEELIADILPPPEYIIEPYATVLEAWGTSDDDEQARLIRRFETLKDDYDRHHKYWAGAALDPIIADTMLVRSHTPALAFFKLATNEFIPALQRHDRARAAAVMAQMARSYEQHRTMIDQAVVVMRSRIESERAAVERRTESEAGSLLAMLWLSLLAGVGGAIFIGRSISLSERELRQHRDHLEELVADRTAALSVALDEAEAANRAKSAFLSNMSHELRTPLNAVIGFSELMGNGKHLSPDDHCNLTIIHRSGLHLLTLINDVLELSRFESGRTYLRSAPVELELLLREVMDIVRARPQFGAALRLDCHDLPASVVLDGAKLRQVLLNLLSNALKFGKRGMVTMSAHGKASEDGHSHTLSFAVRDEGIGIAADDYERVFRPFGRAAATNQVDGAGLGLSIARNFVRMMGGELSFESELGVGTVFRFTLTAESAGAASGLPKPARTEMGHHPVDPHQRVVVSSTSLSAIPEVQLRALREALQALDVVRIDSAIEAMHAWHAELAREIGNLVSRHQYQHLCAIIDATLAAQPS